MRAAEIQKAMETLAAEICEAHPVAHDLILLGVANGGIPFAQRLAVILASRYQQSIPCGQINAQFHRDDLEDKPFSKSFQGTEIPFDIDGKKILLADDVLFSGRTVRAALNEIFDYGRPESVELVVLVDRGHRRLPIEATYTGLQVDVSPFHKVVVSLSTTDPHQDSITLQEL